MNYFIMHNKSGVFKKTHFQAQTSIRVCEEKIPLEYNSNTQLNETTNPRPTPYSKY